MCIKRHKIKSEGEKTLNFKCATNCIGASRAQSIIKTKSFGHAMWNQCHAGTEHICSQED